MILYGASGHAKVIIDTLEKNNEIVSLLIDDNKQITELLGYRVSCDYNATFLNYSNEKFIVSIGNNKIRKKIVSLIKHDFGQVISRDTVVSKHSKVGVGSVIFSGAIIQAGTKIGEHCIVNTKASVDHDCLIADFVHIAPGSTICGGVSIGEGSFIGAGAIILPNIKIGNRVTVGAGAVVVSNIPDNEVWVGNPAKFLRINKIEKKS